MAKDKDQTCLDSLTGFRAFASLWILTAHFLFMPAYDVGFGNKIDLKFAYGMFRFDFLGVDLFLVLSGFFLYRSHRNDFEVKPVYKAIDRFYLIRLARLYPMHLFTLGLMGVIHASGVAHPIVSGRQNFIFEHWPITLFLNIAMMNCWGIIPVASWNEPAWTISALWFVYLIFPTWIILPKALKSTSAQVIGIVVMLVALEVSFYFIRGITASDGIGSLIRATTLFMVGCFIYNLYEKGITFRSWWNDVVFLSCIILLSGAVTFFVFVEIFPLILLHLFYPILVLTLVGSVKGVRYVFANRVVVYLGKISYSTYLMHYPVLLIAKHTLSGYTSKLVQTAPQWLLWLHYLGVVAMVLLSASLCYHMIEKPCYKWLRPRL